MTDSATLRAMAEVMLRRYRDGEGSPGDDSLALARGVLALLASQSSWATEKAELERQRDEAREAALQEFEDYHDNQAAMADAIGEVGPMKYHDNAAKAMREFRHASRSAAAKE